MTLRHPSNFLASLKRYVNCIRLTTTTSQLLIGLLVMCVVRVSGTVFWLLVALTVAMHLGAAFNYFKVIESLKIGSLWSVLLFLFIPLGNIYCIIELSKVINKTLDSLALGRIHGTDDIKRIERLLSMT
jgi:hypothetical protein